MVAVALLGTANVFAAPTFSVVQAGDPTTGSFNCDVINSCASNSLAGNLKSPTGTYNATFTVDLNVPSSTPPSSELLGLITPSLNAEFSGTQLCLPMTPDTNLTTLSFADGSKADVTTSSICFAGQDSAGDVIGLFCVTDATNTYANAANGTGWFQGTYGGPGASLGTGFTAQAQVTFATFNLPTTSDGCAGTGSGGGGGGGGGGNPGATPELDSLLLFGSGLAGGVSYLLMRRRAARS